MNIGEHDGPNEEALLYVSWNGATEVSTWRLVFSATPSASRPKQWSLCDKKGFETTCELSSNLPVSVREKTKSRVSFSVADVVAVNH